MNANDPCPKCGLRPSDYPRPERVKHYKAKDGKSYCFDCFLVVEDIEYTPPERSEEQKAGLDHRGMP